MDSAKHASTPQPFFQKTANFMLLPYIYITRVRAICEIRMWYCEEEEWRGKRKTVVRKITWTSWTFRTHWIIAGSKTKTKINPLMRMVTFRMKVVHKLSVWALRARSYKTKAEDWAAGHRPPSSSRGLSWFLSYLKQWVQKVQEVQKVQGVQGIFLTTVFHISSLLSSSSQHHILISRMRTRNLYIR